jgi:hypothetical protein
MKRILLILLFLLFLINCFFSAFSQSDWGSSFSVDVSKKLLPKLNLSLEEDFRLRDNFSTAERFSSTLEMSYKPWKFLKTGGAYNLINYNHPTKNWEIRHRYYLYAMGIYSLKRFTLSLRERFQSTYRAGVEETSTRANPKNYLRSRLKLEYNIRKSHFEPYFSAEFYNTLNDPQENEMNKIRYSLGTAYKLNKRNSFELYYRYTNFLEDDEISGKNMICVSYSFSWRK